MDLNSYEYSAEQKCEGKWMVYRLLMLSLYVIYVIAFVLVIYGTPVVPLGALIPFTLWIIVFFTWRYVKLDYKYIIDSSMMTFYVIYGGRTKKERVSFHIKDAYLIDRVEAAESKIEGFAPKRIYSAVPSKDCPDVYAALFYGKSGEASVLYFRATAQALKCLSFYNREATVITPTLL